MMDFKKKYLNEGRTELRRALLYMTYNPLETLSENKKNILEQTGYEMQLDRQYGDPEWLRRQEELRAERIARTYPNYCKYPNRAVVPPKNKAGVEGIETIPEGKCAYLAPAPHVSEPMNPNYAVVFIDAKQEITFNDIDTQAEIIKDIESKVPQLANMNATDKSKFYRFFRNVFPQGTVYSFEHIGEYYKLSWKKGTGHEILNIQADWYKGLINGKYYPTYETYDPRTKWDKIVDDWGDAAQWIAAGAFFVAGFFTEGATWLLLAELTVEGTLGIINAQRHLERGMNLAAGFDLLFSLTPFLKTHPVLRGVKNETANELVSSMYKAGIRADTAPEKVLEWYMTLPKTSQKLFSKMLRNGDEFAEAKMKKYFAEGVEEFKKFFKQNPGVLHNIRWYQKLGVLELSVNGIIAFLDWTLDALYGEQLTDQQKKRFTGIYNLALEIDKKLADELVKNATTHVDVLPEWMETNQVREIEKDLSNPAIKKSASYFNRVMSDSLSEVNGVWFEDPDDPNKPAIAKGMDAASLEKWEQENPSYKREDKIKGTEWNDYTEPIKINDYFYWKKNKK